MTVLLPACYIYTLLHSMGQKRETPFLNPRQVCAAVRLAACPRLILWRLTAYSCDSKESSNRVKSIVTHCTLNIEHCTLIHLAPHAGKKASLNQTERNVVKRTPRYGSSVTLAKRSVANLALWVQRHAGRLTKHG